MKKVAFLLVILFVAVSCEKGKDLYEPPVVGEQKDFSLFDNINVTSDLPDNTRCLLFTADPRGEANQAEPIMVAYAPFNNQVRVAKGVQTLYAYVNGDILEFPRKDIMLKGSGVTRSTVVTRADDELPLSTTQVVLSDAFITAINAFYPEKVVNVSGDDLKVCTDLLAPKGIKSQTVHPDESVTTEYWDNTRVWLTYVTDGGCGFSGSLWYYPYQVDDNDGIITSLAEVEANLVLLFENATPANSKGTRIYLGEFAPGTRIGFKYLGNATLNGQPYPKYSTPYYNQQAYGSANEATSGVIRKWDYEGKEYATLGMENRLPSEGSAWDGDFNDMLLLVEADPLFIENVIPPPVVVPEYITWQGYWLFEDNYPLQGDYDFNDLVVKYAITETKNKPTIIDLQFMAKGATNVNSFGINGTIYFENLFGYENVFANANKVTQVIKQITMAAASEYVPMLNNGTHSFNLNTFYDLDEDFPCILNIPIVNNSTFQWCLEYIRIDSAYPRYTNWVNSDCVTNTDWYMDVPVANTTWNK